MPIPVSLARSARLLSVLLLAVLIGGCANRGTIPERQAKSAIAHAAKAAKKGNASAVQSYIHRATTFRGEEYRIAKFFEGSPNAASLYIAATTQYIDSTYLPGQVVSQHQILSILRSANALPDADLDALSTHLVQHARKSNLNGRIKFTLADQIDEFDLLGSPEHSALILGRSISATQAESSRQAIEILSYAADPSLPASQRRTIEESLDSLYITREELLYAKAVFPAFAKRRGEALGRLGGSRLIEVGKSTWESLSPNERMAIEKDVRVSVLADQSYGVITDTQGVDRSTAATHYGAAIGSGVAQMAYVARALDGGSYSPWMQLGLGVLGAVIGSAADRPAVQQYQHRYAVKFADGEIQSFDQTNGDPFHHPAGTCVSVPSLEPLSQKVCQHTRGSLMRMAGGPIPGVTELHARK